MGFRTVITKEDLLKGEIIKPGWTPCEVTSYEEKPADTDKSVNLLYILTVIDGPDKGKGGMLRFNEKALGFGKKFWPLVITGWKGDGTDEMSSERAASAVGKKLKVFWQTGKGTKKDGTPGNEYNEAKDFMPIA